MTNKILTIMEFNKKGIIVNEMEFAFNDESFLLLRSTKTGKYKF